MKSDRVISLPRPLAHQVPLLASPARFKVACCGRRWGKTTAAKAAIVAGHGPGQVLKGAVQGGKCWWVAPSYPMATSLWHELKAALAPAWLDKSEDERTIRLPGGGSVTVKSADNPDSLRGEGLDGVVFDECAFAAPATWFEALRPALADRRGWALFISTPKGMNWFYELFQAAQGPSWQRWQLPAADNPIIPPGELDEARRGMPSISAMQELDAQFVSAGAGIFHAEWFKYFLEHVDRGSSTYMLGSKIVPASKCQTIVTVDPAISVRTSADYSAIAVIAITPQCELVLLDLVRDRLEAPALLKRIKEVNALYHPSFIGIEKVAYQASLIQYAREGGLPIRELRADKDKVARALTLVARMEQGQVYFPKDAPFLRELEAELLSFPGGAHDDMVDALGYAAIEGVEDMFLVERFRAATRWDDPPPPPKPKEPYMGPFKPADMTWQQWAQRLRDQAKQAKEQQAGNNINSKEGGEVEKFTGNVSHLLRTL